MKNSILAFILCFTAGFTFAQTEIDKKYLAGAVPEENGKVIFKKIIFPEKALSDERIFQLAEEWVQENYGKKENPEDERKILYINPEEKKVACFGEEVFTFKRSAWVLDQAFMYYQLILDIQDGKCIAEIRQIKYKYNDGTKTELHLAEETITDKIAVNSKGTKLNRFYDKFRTYTIDVIPTIFDSLESYLNREGE